MLEVLSVWSKLTEWSNDLKEYMINNDKSVIVYGGIFLIGIAIFAIVYSALNKNE